MLHQTAKNCEAVRVSWASNYLVFRMGHTSVSNWSRGDRLEPPPWW